MKVKLDVLNGIVYWRRIFHTDEVVGAYVDGRLNLNKDFHAMLIDKNAIVKIDYKYIAPKNDFRRKF